MTWALDSTARDSPALAPAPAPRALRLVPQPQHDPAQALPVKGPSKPPIGRHIRKLDLTAPQGRQVTSSRTGTRSAGRPQIKSWQLRRPPPEKSWLPLRSSEYPIQIIIPEVRLFFSASTDLPFQFLPYNTCPYFFTTNPIARLTRSGIKPNPTGTIRKSHRHLSSNRSCAPKPPQPITLPRRKAHPASQKKMHANKTVPTGSPSATRDSFRRHQLRQRW